MSQDYLQEGFKEVMLSTLIAIGALGLNDVSNVVVGAEDLSTSELRKVASNTSAKVYKVEKGDSLSAIANKFNVSLQDILKYNKNISNPNKISVGQLILIPSEIIANSSLKTDQKPLVSKNKANPIGDSSFIDYMKRVENGIKSGWSKSRKLWFPHISSEGGNKSIAYGHKLTNEERDNNTFARGITDKEAHRLLLSDLKNAETRAISHINDIVNTVTTDAKVKYKLNRNARRSYHELGLKEKQIALDYSYNLRGGLKVFPTFFTALLNGDIDTMQKEYKRSYVKDGVRKPLEDRNKQFYERYLKSYEPSK